MHQMLATRCCLTVCHAQVGGTALAQIRLQPRSVSLDIGVPRVPSTPSRAAVELSRRMSDSQTVMSVCRDSTAMITIVPESMIVLRALGAGLVLSFLLLAQRVRLEQHKIYRQNQRALSVQQGSFVHHRLWWHLQSVR